MLLTELLFFYYTKPNFIKLASRVTDNKIPQTEKPETNILLANKTSILSNNLTTSNVVKIEIGVLLSIFSTSSCDIMNLN